jgi:hypothetical protein
MTFTIKKGDTSPALTATLIDADGEPAPLTLADKVEFFLNTPRSDQKISADMSSGVSILNPDEGRVSYSWSDGDTDVVGQREAEFVVTFENGKVQSYPNDGFIYVIVERDVETL